MYLILLQHNTPALLDHHAYMCVTIQAIRIVDEETSYEHKTFLQTRKRKSPIEYIHSRCHHRHLTSFFFNYTESIQAKLCLVKRTESIQILGGFVLLPRNEFSSDMVYETIKSRKKKKKKGEAQTRKQMCQLCLVELHTRQVYL